MKSRVIIQSSLAHRTNRGRPDAIFGVGEKLGGAEVAASDQLRGGDVAGFSESGEAFESDRPDAGVRVSGEA